MYLTNRLEKDLEKELEKYSIKNGIKLDEKNKQQIKTQYFIQYPKMLEKYKTKMNILKKLERRITLGAIGVTTIAVGTTLYLTRSNEKDTNVSTIEPERIEEMVEVESKETEDVDELKQKLEQNRTEEYINNLRKEIIVEQYNKENPEAQITVDDLKIEESTLYLIATLDKFGNEVSYNRKLIDDYQKEVKENQKLVEGMYHYIYKIDNEIVAIYNTEGTPIQNKGKTYDDTFFQTTVPLVNNAVKLRNLYKFENTDEERSQGEQRFVDMARQLERMYQNIKSEEITK